MIPIVDMHVHLLAGLDDGPRTREDALEMCRQMCEQGVHSSVALAHQNEGYPQNTPERIREATQLLRQELQEVKIPLTVYPGAEVTLEPDLMEHWSRGRLLSVGDHREYLLLELTRGQYHDPKPFILRLKEERIRVILAHAERVPTWLEEPAKLEELVRLGCLVQITASAFARPANPRGEKVLRDWATRGLIHLLGSDGHSVRRRPPHSRAGVQVLERWLGRERTEKIAGTNGLAILKGEPLIVDPPEPPARGWFSRLFE